MASVKEALQDEDVMYTDLQPVPEEEEPIEEVFKDSVNELKESP